LEEGNNSPLGVRLVKLITAQDQETSQRAQSLLQAVSEEVEENKLRNDIIDLIESIMIYKFPQIVARRLLPC